MKAILLSLKPYWLFLIIANKMGWNIGKEKTVEVRKSYPKDNDWNKIVNLYCTKDIKSFRQIPKEYQPQMEKFLGKVIGEFACDKIYDIAYNYYYPVGYDVSMGEISREQLYKMSCLEFIDFDNYLGWENGYGWHISDLLIYNEPKELSELYTLKKCNSCNDSGYESDACIYDDNCLVPVQLKRPPQSWCYVEVIK